MGKINFLEDQERHFMFQNVLKICLEISLKKHDICLPNHLRLL
jgi:hypothetical protein